MKGSDALIVRQLLVHRLHRRFHMVAADVPRDESGEIALPVSHHNDLLGAGEGPEQLVLDRFRRYVMAGTQDQQILDASGDPPVSGAVRLALIARMEPAVAQDAGGGLRPPPVTLEDVR